MERRSNKPILRREVELRPEPRPEKVFVLVSLAMIGSFIVMMALTYAYWHHAIRDGGPASATSPTTHCPASVQRHEEAP